MVMQTWPFSFFSSYSTENWTYIQNCTQLRNTVFRVFAWRRDPSLHNARMFISCALCRENCQHEALPGGQPFKQVTWPKRNSMNPPFFPHTERKELISKISAVAFFLFLIFQRPVIGLFWYFYLYNLFQ